MSDLGKEFTSWQAERAKKRGRKSETFSEFFEDITDEFLTFLEGGLPPKEGGSEKGSQARDQAGDAAARARASAQHTQDGSQSGSQRAQERAQAGAQQARQQAEAGAERARQTAKQSSYDVDKELAEMKKRMGL